MSDQGNIILGLSPGTNTMGEVLYSDGTIMDWRLRTFREAWSEEKFLHITKAVVRMMEKYRVQVLVLKTPTNGHRSAGMKRLFKEIKVIAKKRNVQVHEYALEELERFYSREKRVSKRTLVEALVKEHPELLLDYDRAMRDSSPYQKIFEAAAAVELYRHDHLRKSF